MIQNRSSKRQEAYTETDTITRLLNGTVRKNQLRLFAEFVDHLTYLVQDRTTKSKDHAVAESAITVYMLAESFVRVAKRSITIISEFSQLRKHAGLVTNEIVMLGSLSREKGRAIDVAIGTSEQAKATA